MTKLTNDAVAACGTLLAGAGALFTFGTAPLPFFEAHRGLFLASGLGATGLGVGLIVWRVGIWIHSRTRRRSQQLILQSQTAKRSDLPELYELYSKQFGDDIPTLERMRTWYSRNPNIFRIVVLKDVISGARKIVASFKAVPLKNVTIAFLELEALSGTNLPEDHIVRPRGRASAWYLGDLVSTSRVSAIAVMRDLVEYLSANVQADTPIYARGLTEKGLSLLRDYYFEPVGENRMEIGRICRLTGTEVQELLDRIRGKQPSRSGPRTRQMRPRSTARSNQESLGPDPTSRPLAG